MNFEIIAQIILFGIALAMDAFAVSILMVLFIVILIRKEVSLSLEHLE